MDAYSKYQERWLRQCYLNTVAHGEPRVRRCFDSVLFYEEAIGRMLPEFTPDDLAGWEERLPKDKRQEYRSILTNFVRWARGTEPKAFHQDAFEKRVASCADSYVASPYDLAKRLDQIHGPTGTDGPPLTCRAYLWLLYSGVKMGDALKLMAEDIDLDAMEVRYQGWNLKLSDYSYPDLRTLKDAPALIDRYNHRRNKPAGAPFLWWYGDVSIGDFNARLAHQPRRRGFYALSPREVYHSGLFYRAFLRELDGIPADFEVYTGGSLQRYNSAEPYDVDYAAWKYLFIRPLIAGIPTPDAIPIFKD